MPLSWLSFYSFPPGRRQSARGKLTSQGLSGSSASEDVLSISNNQVFHIEVQVNKSTERAHFTRPKNATLIIDQKKATLAKNFAFNAKSVSRGRKTRPSVVPHARITASHRGVHCGPAGPAWPHTAGPCALTG